ncbi:virulence factor lipase-like protein [Marinobacter sp. 3-2]|jgi:hypothetical protein|uniref:hypothetical protein n=1 Tax=Marinobacter sp. 3-2 TaxID=2485141 RepID=UPI000D39D4F9|nr:hypothetical protein [Marinobacter sp. 3-2]ROQ39285.1 virulence factor lipase-like protein [Marinobacter sp. 3-2]
MFKKTLISLAVASSVGLTGCFDSGETGANANPDYQISNPELDGTWPLFNPVTGNLPLPNDLIFRSDNEATVGISEADGSFSVADSAPPVTSALNQLSGASTIAPAVVRFSGQIDEESVDSRAFVLANPEDPTSVIPNPNQNVFLIELEYASGDPVLGLSAGEPPTVSLGILLQRAQGGDPAAAQELGAKVANPDYVAEVVTLDGTSAIRINPTKPLNPFKRYLVVVTKEVLDVNGEPILQDPLYRDVADPDRVLGNPTALAPVRRIVDGFWEQVASGFFENIANVARPADAALTEEDIALSYSFTTSNDERVLPYITDPALYLTDTIRGQARLAGIEAALDAEITDYTALLTAGDQGEAAFEADAGATIEQVAAGAVAGIQGGGVTFPTPTDHGSTATFGDPQDVTIVSAVAGQFVDFGQVNAIQGTITLPYYLGVPTGPSDAEGSVINNQSWAANSTIATVGSDVLGLENDLAQSQPTVSTVVNYRFPFPQKTADVEVPMLVLLPDGYDPATDPTVMYMHGITTDRSTALTFGSALANAAGVAVVAIDHPLHGVTPFSAEEQQALAQQLLASGQAGGLPESLAPNEANINAVIAGQIAVGFVLGAVAADEQADPIDPVTAATVVADVVSGGTIADLPGISTQDALLLDPAIRTLRSFENTVANAGSTVPGLAKTDNERHFDFTASAANTPTAMTATSGESGSLFINLTNFTNTRDKNRQSVVDLLNVRMSLGSIDLDGDETTPDLNSGQVYYVGHSLGTIVGLPFVSVANESSTADDNIVAASMLTPGGGIVRLLENSPTFAPQILGGLQAAAGLEQGDADLETFLNVFQAAVDTVDPVNFTDNLLESTSKISLHQVNGDTVIPNDPLANPLGNAFDAYLSGTEPLASLLDAVSVNTTNTAPIAALGGIEGVELDPAAITRYLEGTHGTPVLPAGGELDERVFAEMVGQTGSLISTGGIAVIQDPAGEEGANISEIVQQD